MKDLTQGPIARHVVQLAIPVAAGMLLQMLYFFVDLCFVSRLGPAAIAGVSAGGNLMFIVFALTIPAVFIARRPGFQLPHLLLLSIASTLMQAGVSLAWLRVEFRKRPGPLTARAAFVPESARSA